MRVNHNSKLSQAVNAVLLSMRYDKHKYFIIYLFNILKNEGIQAPIWKIEKEFWKSLTTKWWEQFFSRQNLELNEENILKLFGLV
jgi:hypothetical protein